MRAGLMGGPTSKPRSGALRPLFEGSDCSSWECVWSSIRGSCQLAETKIGDPFPENTYGEDPAMADPCS